MANVTALRQGGPPTMAEGKFNAMVAAEMADGGLEPFKMLMDTLADMKADIRATETRVGTAERALLDKLAETVRPITADLGNLRDRQTKLETQFKMALGVFALGGTVLGSIASWVAQHLFGK